MGDGPYPTSCFSPKHILPLLLAAGLVAAPGCTTTTITIAAEPSTAELVTGQTQTITAIITGTENPAEREVIWSVCNGQGENCVDGGNSTLGTVAPFNSGPTSGNPTVVYTAPASVPSPPLCRATRDGCAVAVRGKLANFEAACFTTITIHQPLNPAPTVTSLSPASAPAEGPAFTLSVFGSGFIASSVVRWQGSNRITTFVSSTELKAAIPASDVAVAGTAIVTVFNPAPGGGTSGVATFTILPPGPSNPVPSITSISPDTVTAGGRPFTLDVLGSGFITSSVVRVNGNDRSTTFLSPTQLQAAIPDTDIGAVGTASITVFSPAPGGGTSNTVFLTISSGVIAPELLSFNAAGTASGTKSSFVSCGPRCVSADGRFVLITSESDDLVTNDNNGVGDIFIRDRIAGTTSLVTVNLSGTSSPTTPSIGTGGGSMTPDGRFVVFASPYSDLVLNDFNEQGDVFLRDTCAGAPAGCTPRTILISENSAGTGTANGGSGLAGSDVSPDGRFVVFTSSATDLEPIDTDGLPDIFLRDTCIGAPLGCTPSTILISVNSAGTASANGVAEGVVVSPDGRFVAFASTGTDLVSTSDTNGGFDLFVRDTCIGALTDCTPATFMVTVNSSGTDSGNVTTGGGGGLLPAAITLDGSRVVFFSRASDLVAGATDGNSTFDVFVRDLPNGPTQLISLNAAGTAAGDGISQIPRMTPDGRYVVFASLASDLVVADTNGNSDVFLRDTCFGAPGGCTPSTELVSINAASTGSGNGGSSEPSISDDATRVAFVTIATDLFATPPATGAPGAVLRDRVAGITVPLTLFVDFLNNPAFGTADNISISGTGKVAVYGSPTDMMAEDTNELPDVYATLVPPL